MSKKSLTDRLWGIMVDHGSLVVSVLGGMFLIMLLLMAGPAKAQEPRSYYGTISPGATVTFDMKLTRSGFLEKNPSLVTVWTTTADTSAVVVTNVSNVAANDGWSIRSNGNYFPTNSTWLLKGVPLQFVPRRSTFSVTNRHSTAPINIFVLAEY